MPAFLERIDRPVFILRAGPRAVAYGDPYSILGCVADNGDGSCEIKGFIRRLDDGDLSVFREIGQCLKDAGFTKFMWDREALNSFRKVRIETDGYL